MSRRTSWALQERGWSPPKNIANVQTRFPVFGTTNPSRVGVPFSGYAPTTAHNRNPTRQSTGAAPCLDSKWAESLINLIIEIPNFSMLRTRCSFQDALQQVNTNLLESKQVVVEAQADNARCSSEWKAKEQKYLKEITQLTDQVQLFQRELVASQGDKGRRDSNKYEKEIERLRRENENIKSQLQSTKAEKDQLLHRLSKLAGDKLSDNNPDITDLSDPNRPEKLALMYSELYDNVWTNAIESMPGVERGNIRELLTIFVEIWRFCRNLGKHQLTSMENLLLHPWLPSNTKPTGSQAVTYHTEIMKSIKDARKVDAKETRKRLFKHFLHEKSASYRDDVYKYAEACMDLCWLCAIQDPPIEFMYNVKEGGKIDSQCFKPYDRSGQIIEYLVWPAMLLHQEGPVLSKGAVQVAKAKKIIDYH